MFEPCWQIESVSREYVYKDLLFSVGKTKECKNIVKISKKLPHLILDYCLISKIIHKIIDIEYGKFNGFGSLRGYSSTRQGLLESINEKIKELNKIKALRVLSNSILINNWVNHVLYKVDGLRYYSIKEDFEKASTKLLKKSH